MNLACSSHGDDSNGEDCNVEEDKESPIGPDEEKEEVEVAIGMLGRCMLAT